MSNGKKWKMTSKQIHRIRRHCQRYSYWRVYGGKNEPSPGFKAFRNRKRSNQIMDACHHLGMRKLAAMEIWYWD